MQDFFTNTMDSLGYWGVALLMLLENIVPPVPSEIVMPAAGAAARKGEYSLIGMILAGSVGAILGALPWYGVARYIGKERFRDWIDRHGHWLGTDRGEFDRADKWFDRSGRWAVLICRLIPGVRTLISIPAGFAEMPLRSFLTCTAIGTLAWSALLAGLGYWLQQHEPVASVVNWIGLGVFTLLVLWFVSRIIKRKLEKNRTAAV